MDNDSDKTLPWTGALVDWVMEEEREEICDMDLLNPILQMK
jgi:hypothetical protein